MNNPGYIILTAPYANDLELKVARQIKDGWIPLGGVSVAVDNQHYIYAQAMVTAQLYTMIK